MYFDTHAHYDDDWFDEDRNEIFEKKLPEANVSLVLNNACNIESSKKCIEFAENYEYIYAAIGYHPSDAHNFTEEGFEFLRQNSSHPKVKAIGEIGLDYYHTTEFVAEQKVAFRRQMELAREMNLPVVIHDREAHADSLAMVKEFPEVTGVFHCYSGSVEMAEELLKLSYFLSFTGSITFKNARKAPDVIKATPIDRILIETDAPYLAPVPYRGKRNDSSYLPHVVDVIAELKGLTHDEVAKITKENGKRLFKI